MMTSKRVGHDAQKGWVAADQCQVEPEHGATQGHATRRSEGRVGE